MTGPAKAVFIIVNGQPATGKTTFARKLSESVRIPLFSKDDFKETLYEQFGAADREASRMLGVAAYTLLRHTSEAMLRAGSSLIIESNFEPEYAGRWISELEISYSPTTIQVLLHADPEAILERYATRALERHPAHFDDIAIDELRTSADVVPEPLSVTGSTLSFDTSDFARFEECEPIDAVKSLVLPASRS